MKRPLILISNDDSYSARGVHFLIDCLRGLGDVVAVCPSHPQSGKSMALTVNDPLRVREIPIEGARMYSLTGTPVDCIKVAHHHLLERRPDIVVAGVNHGSNAAVNVLYSGTMGAAMEGAVLGIPAIGFSLTDHSPDANFEPCRRAVKLLTQAVLQNGLPENVCLNVNIPDLDHEPAEMRLCTPCHGRWDDEYKQYTDPSGNRFFMLSGRFENLEPDNKTTDEWALAHGLISVVPVAVERSIATAIEIPWLTHVLTDYKSR